MKRFLACLLILALLPALAAPARADVLWTPNNSFYEQHYDDCEYVGRSYYANGPEGFVTLWNAPDGSLVEGQYQNGAKLLVYWRYEDWGCITVWGDGGEVTGWVPMADLYLVYDYISFEEEYGHQFRDYNGEFADYDGDAETISFFSYPGAPEIQYTYTLADWGEVLSNLTGTADQNSYIRSVYVDENGLTWGFVGYMYGRLNAWFCLDDPAAAGIMTSCIPEADELIAAGELTAPQTPVLPTVAYVPYLLVGAVVAVTAILLAVFFRKRTKKKS